MKADSIKVCLGTVVGVHGIKGEVKVKSYTAADTDIGSYGPLSSEDGTQTFTLKVTGHSKELLRCKIKGVDNRDMAETLIGFKFYVNRDKLPELTQTDEYYLTDLVGLKVLDMQNHEVGKVSGLYNFGAGDILELKLSNTQTEMLPFNKAYVPEVNISEGFVRVRSVGMNFAPDEESDVES